MDLNTVKSFAASFFEAEASARDAQVRPDLEEYNRRVLILQTFAIDSAKDHFGVLPRKRPFPQQLYDNFKDAPPFEPARLFRLDRYLLESGGDAWGFFASQVGQSGDKVLFHLYIASEVEGQLKVIRQFYLDTLDSGERVWTPSGGDESITLESLGKPVEIHRLLEPSDDADSMRIYLAD